METAPRRVFTPDDTWNGGCFELALEVGPRSDERLRAVVNALWQCPLLAGCYLDPAAEPWDQPLISPADRPLDSGHRLLGIAALPNGARVACGSCLVREEEGPDWLDFYIPLGALGTAYPVGAYPFGSEPSRHWRAPVESWLAQIGLYVASRSSYSLGLIGWEVSGQVYAAEVAAQGVPSERWLGYLWPSDNAGVVYHPSTT
jgi:hypothetical protein